MTKDHPIIFSTEMVRAILDGRKTQTRKVIKKVSREEDSKWNKNYTTKDWFPCSRIQMMLHIEDMLKDQSMSQDFCPYGQSGDKLWVRETYCSYIPLKKSVSNHSDDSQLSVIYKASHKLSDMEGFKDLVLQQDINWKPSIFMPRWASRITLEITDVRVERLQEIIAFDCYEEGIARPRGTLPYIPTPNISADKKIVNCFQTLWNSIHKKQYRWQDNPWVWMINFKRIK